MTAPEVTAKPYTFHLTIDVQPDRHEAYRAYKLQSLHQLSEQAGHRWTLLLRSGQPRPNRYYQVTQLDSEASLDAAMQTPAARELVARAQPYRLMSTSPAQRDVVTVLLDDRAAARDVPAAATHAHWPPADDGDPESVVALLREYGLGAPGGRRRLLLALAGEPGGLIYLALGTQKDLGAGAPSPYLADGAVWTPCELVLDLPAA